MVLIQQAKSIKMPSSEQCLDDDALKDLVTQCSQAKWKPIEHHITYRKKTAARQEVLMDHYASFLK